MMRLSTLAAMLVVSASCVLTAGQAQPDLDIAGLWQEPADLEQRDLLHGVGGRALLPSSTARYTVVKVDKDGFSPGYEVRDEQGRLWNVKLGPESQTEVVASRLLWAVGYHQPAAYHLPRWTATEKGKSTAQPGGRFRLEPESQDKVGEWSWRDNPFVGTRPFGGLFVLMVLINNWDLKTSQNAVYQDMQNGEGPRDLYVVKDLGASFGKTNWLFPGTRGDVEGFEREGFIRKVENNRVTFHYQGGWREPHLVAGATPADVRWIADLLARLSTQQWNDAFRAGGYGDAEAARYIKRLREKIADGQAIG
jgi:hypothetical protein